MISHNHDDSYNSSSDNNFLSSQINMIYCSRAVTLTLSSSRLNSYTVKVILTSNTYVPQGYIRLALNLHSRNFTTALQDPDGAAAFCHHHNIMTNVSFNSLKLEEKYRPSCKNELDATNK